MMARAVGRDVVKTDVVSWDSQPSPQASPEKEQPQQQPKPKAADRTKKLLTLSANARKRSRTVSMSVSDDDDDFIEQHNKRLKRQPSGIKIVSKSRSRLVNNLKQVAVGSDTDHEFDYARTYPVSEVRHDQVVSRKQTKHGQGYQGVGEHLLSLKQLFPGGNRHAVVKVGCSSEFTPSNAVKFDAVNKCWAFDFAAKNLFQDNCTKS